MTLSNEDYTEISLAEIVTVVWRRKLIISVFTVAFMVFSFTWSYFLPNQYVSEIVVSPTNNRGAGLGGIISNYGGLAELAGIDLPSESSNRLYQSIILMESWPFLEQVIKKYGYEAEIYAAKAWNEEQGTLIYDQDVYVDGGWVNDNAPTGYKLYISAKNRLLLKLDKTSNILTVSFEHESPEFAKKFLEKLIEEINLNFKQKDSEVTVNNIEYLNKKIEEIPIAEMKAVFYAMIQEQMKTQMLADVKSEYVFEVVVPPEIPEGKAKPRRMLITVFGGLVGFVLTIFILIILHLRARANSGEIT